MHLLILTAAQPHHSLYVWYCMLSVHKSFPIQHTVFVELYYTLKLTNIVYGVWHKQIETEEIA